MTRHRHCPLCHDVLAPATIELPKEYGFERAHGLRCAEPRCASEFVLITTHAVGIALWAVRYRAHESDAPNFQFNLTDPRFADA